MVVKDRVPLKSVCDSFSPVCVHTHMSRGCEERDDEIGFFRRASARDDSPYRSFFADDGIQALRISSSVGKDSS